MERDYKKWLQQQEALKKQREEEELKNSVLNANIQEKQNSIRFERQPEPEDRNYDRKQKITRLKNSISDRIQEEPQLAKAGKFMKQKVGDFTSNNPKLTQSYNSFKDRRAQEIEKMKERIKNEVNAQAKRRVAQVAQKASQVAARVAAQAARALVVAAGEALGSMAVAAAGSIGVTGAILLVVAVFIVIIIASFYQACNDNVLYSTICEGVTLVGKGINWIMGW